MLGWVLATLSRDIRDYYEKPVGLLYSFSHFRVVIRLIVIARN